MKIALISEYYYPLLGGITEHVHNLARTLDKLGHDVTVITHNVRPRKNHHFPDEPAGFPVVRFGRGVPIYSNGSFARITVSKSLISDVQRFFERERFDIIHAHSPLTPILPLVALHNSNAPVTVGTFHTYFDQSRGYNLIRNKATEYMEKMDGRIVVSKACVEALSRYFDADYKVIPNGVDPESFSPEVETLPQFDDDKLNILFVGRFDPRNGLRMMIESFKQVKREFSNCRLIVVGDGPLRLYYRSLIDKEIKDDVHFAGLVNGARPDYYSSADIFCTPCTKASFGVVLLEAMSSGTPIVASDINGYRLVMEDGRQGTLVRQQTPEAFTDALLDLLDDPGKRRRMSIEGRRAALESFSWDLVGKQVERYYMHLMDKAFGLVSEPEPEEALILNT